MKETSVMYDDASVTSRKRLHRDASATMDSSLMSSYPGPPNEISWSIGQLWAIAMTDTSVTRQSPRSKTSKPTQLDTTATADASVT